MVSLRFHIVSLVAVFLALAIGVIAGTTVIDQGVVNVLENQTDALREARDAARAESDLLRRTLGIWDGFGRRLMPAMVGDALAGRQVVLVMSSEAPPDLIRDVEVAIAQAEGSVEGSLTLTAKWALEESGAVEQLALVVGADAAPPDLLAEAALALALRLRVSQNPSDENDMLRRLAEAGFTTTTVDGRPFPSRDALFIYVASANDQVIPADTFVLPLVRALAQDGAAIAVAAPLEAAGGLVDRIRSDASLRNVVATVDHADTLPGRIALVSALAEVARGAPAHHYGERADEVAPPPNGRP